MKLKTTLLIFVALVILGCKLLATKKEKVSNSSTEIVESQQVSDYLTDWVNALNSNNISAIENIYASKAFKVISEGNIIETSSQIAEYYRNNKSEITSIESLFKIEANKRRLINYEIVNYKTKDQKEHVQLVIWKLENGQVIREFEFSETRNHNANEVDINSIAERRNLWMELCNTNNTEELVKELYSTNTIYYNHKPLVIGSEDLIKEYGYMNNSNYSLKLRPLKLEIINSDLAYEIGQCSEGYNGKYIIIWKKQHDGNWKVYIDSNI